MKKLIKSEMYKLFRLPFYIFLLFMAAVFAVFDNSVYMRASSIVEWIAITPINHIYIIILIFMLTADFVGGDFSNRALMPALLCGEPRRNLIFAKYIAIFTGILPILAVYELTGVDMVFRVYGFQRFSNFLWTFISSNFYCAIEDLVVISIALFMSLVVKNKIFLVLSGSCGYYALYVIFTNSYQIHIHFWMVLFISTVVIVVTSSASMYIFAKKDLK